MAEIPFEPYTGQSKLRFWCQKVLPLVYDDSLSYYELLGKVIEYLNNTIADVSACEDNITALRDAFVQLQDYVNEQLEDFAPEVERIIDEMVDSGEFGEILTDVVNGLIAGEYNTTQGYAQFDYVLKDGKLYCATASTSGEWDSTKWRETTVGTDMQLLNQRVYNLNAGQVAYDNNATYNSNTIGYKINNLNNAGENTLDDCNNFILGIKKVGPATLNMPENAYGFIESYIAQNDSWKWQLLITTQTPQKIFKRANINNTGWTEWVKIVDNTDIDNLNAGQVAFNESDTYDANTVGKKLKDLDDFDDNLNAGQVEYNSENTYNDATVGKELQELKGSLNAVQNQITANIETSATASKAYSANEYLVLNGTLYKVVSPIANGAQITIGTNVIATNIGNELNTAIKTLGFLKTGINITGEQTIGTITIPAGKWLLIYRIHTSTAGEVAMLINDAVTIHDSALTLGYIYGYDIAAPESETIYTLSTNSWTSATIDQLYVECIPIIETRTII